MNKIIDLPNLFFILEELVKERCYSDENVDIIVNKDIKDLVTITIWHYSEEYKCKCERLDIKEGDCIDNAYEKYEVIKHIMKKGGLLNELQDRA